MIALIIFLVWLVVFIILTTVYRITDYADYSDSMWLGALWPATSPFVIVDLVSGWLTKVWEKRKGGDGWD
jgi:hypothetical protein